MKIEKISPNKLKLTFTDEDLKDFGIDFENIKYNSEDTQEIFWNLIEQADIEEEFFRDDAQIVVEAVVSKNNGLTMTVTRNVNSKKTPKIRQKKAKKYTDISPLIYSFGDFEDLVLACKYIEDSFVGISRLYKMDGEYYLVMEALHEEVAVSVDFMLCEYGEKVLNSTVAEGKLSEYGDLLVTDTAIANISANF